MPPATNAITFWITTIIIVIFVWRKVHFKDCEDQHLLVRVAVTATVHEFMEIVKKCQAKGMLLFGEENDSFLRRAIKFGSRLSKDDWVEIYAISADGSELELVAKEKAGDALEEPEDDDNEDQEEE